MYSDQLHKAGLKVTAARIAVLRSLSAQRTALSHQELCVLLERDGLFSDRSTVYRTLDTLHRAGLLHKVPNADGVWLFSTSPEPPDRAHDGEHHVHFRCDACEKTFCMEAAELQVQVALEPDLQHAFQITSKELLLHGYCPDCPPSHG